MKKPRKDLDRANAEITYRLRMPARWVSPPGSIERTEAQGQRELLDGDVLPAAMHPSREAFETLGFTFGEVCADDRLWIPAELPEGWTLKGHPHDSRFCWIIDEQGKPRVEVFFKAVFYDRRADMRLLP